MKVLLLSNPGSPHTIKWARSLAENAVEICILGLSAYDPSVYRNYENIQVHSLGLPGSITGNSEANISKARYLKAMPMVKQLIEKFRPDIVHAHYASSYGLLGALSGFHPYIISVWGADIFEFPRKSFLHGALIKYNFRKADKILSTSQVMAKETGRYTEKPIEVTPFGIDLERFKPLRVGNLFDEGDVVIGTIKGLDKQYGIEFLLRAFAILAERHHALPLKLLIVGGGPLEKSLKQLANELRIDDRTVFAGRVDYDAVVNYHNMLAVFVSLSVIDSESFGVAILEASACEKPVVVADVGGLPEVVADGVTGFVVAPRDPESAAAVIEKLVLDEELRKRMGKAGRTRVKELYDWNENVKQMIRIYQEALLKDLD